MPTSFDITLLFCVAGRKKQTPPPPATQQNTEDANCDDPKAKKGRISRMHHAQTEMQDVAFYSRLVGLGAQAFISVIIEICV